jgi:hypothetical protein
MWQFEKRTIHPILNIQGTDGKTQSQKPNHQSAEPIMHLPRTTRINARQLRNVANQTHPDKPFNQSHQNRSIGRKGKFVDVNRKHPSLDNRQQT